MGKENEIKIENTEPLAFKTVKEDVVDYYGLLVEVLTERKKQAKLSTVAYTQNDWVACITAHLGRASDKVQLNDNEGQGFRENMVKVAAKALAAIEDFDSKRIGTSNVGPCL